MCKTKTNIKIEYFAFDADRFAIDMYNYRTNILQASREAMAASLFCDDHVVAKIEIHKKQPPLNIFITICKAMGRDPFSYFK